MRKINENGIEFGGPAVYRVVVQGTLNQDWAERLAGMEITSISSDAGSPQTVLCGPVRDQSELSGVLETLHELHLSIIKVEQIDEQS